MALLALTWVHPSACLAVPHHVTDSKLFASLIDRMVFLNARSNDFQPANEKKEAGVHHLDTL